MDSLVIWNEIIARLFPIEVDSVFDKQTNNVDHNISLVRSTQELKGVICIVGFGIGVKFILKQKSGYVFQIASPVRTAKPVNAIWSVVIFRIQFGTVLNKKANNLLYILFRCRIAQ